MTSMRDQHSGHGAWYDSAETSAAAWAAANRDNATGWRLRAEDIATADGQAGDGPSAGHWPPEPSEPFAPDHADPHWQTDGQAADGVSGSGADAWQDGFAHDDGGAYAAAHGRVSRGAPSPGAMSGRRAGAGLVGSVLNGAGALVSLGLVIGLAVWGYGLVMRDVSGVPVIRAASGPMRVAPEDPGGRVAPFQGLAINVVAAEGGVAPLPGQITLVAPPPGLSPDDLPAPRLAPPAGSAVPAGIAPGSAAPASGTHDGLIPGATGTEDAVMAALAMALGLPAPEAEPRAAAPGAASGATTGTRTGPSVPPPTAAASSSGIAAPAALDLGAAPAASPAGPAPPAARSLQIVPAALPGPARTPRPPPRPAGLSAPAGAGSTSSAGPAPSGATLVTDPTSILPGTRLVQFGAFETPDLAAAEWDRLQARLGQHLVGLERVIQQGEGGGRSFYRLRAAGFEDAAAARRLCAVMAAEQVECVSTAHR